MSKKRGRPISILGDDPAIVRRREKTAERVRRYLERKRATRQGQNRQGPAQNIRRRDAENFSNVSGQQTTCLLQDLGPFQNTDVVRDQEGELYEESARHEKATRFFDPSGQNTSTTPSRTSSTNNSSVQSLERDNLDLERNHESSASQGMTANTCDLPFEPDVAIENSNALFSESHTSSVTISSCDSNVELTADKAHRCVVVTTTTASVADARVDEIHVSEPGAALESGISFATLREVPHLFLGRLVGSENVAIYVFFPYLEASRGTTILTIAQLTRWTDKVLNPAIYRHYPAHLVQHLPAGYKHALANSKARQVESRKTTSAGYQSQQAMLYQASYLTSETPKTSRRLTCPSIAFCTVERGGP